MLPLAISALSCVQWVSWNVSPGPIRGQGLASVYISQELLHDWVSWCWTVEMVMARVSPESFIQSLWLKHKTFKWKGLFNCSFIHKKSQSDIIAFSESDPSWKKLNKLVCFVKVEIIRKNLKVCFSFCLNPKLPGCWRVLSISVLHLQGSLNLFFNALNSLDNNAFFRGHAHTWQGMLLCIFSTHSRN